MPVVDNVIQSMCVGELAVWNARRVSYEAALAEYEKYNSTRQSTFLFKIQDRNVSILDKPAFFTREQLTDPSGSLAIVADLYKNFLQDVVRTVCPELDTVLAADLDDHGYSSETAPIFVIQKLLGSNSVMLPHFEFFLFEFHESSFDAVPFSNKSPSAAFAGSTTGYRGIITVDTVRKLAFPRLRSAVFFKDNPRVDFRLARIVQSTPEAAQLLMEMGFGSSESSWEEQFCHKFVISMDGNTAACSRVKEVLKSNCVLLKYDSRHVLHYSSHFVPWLHYIPISGDADVDAIIDIERQYPGFFEFVSVEGTKFFRNFLHKERIFDYTGALLRMYAASFERRLPGDQNVIAGGFTQEDRRTSTHTGAFLMLSRSDVIEAYGAVLGREPESEEAIQDHMNAPSVADLYQGLIESEEFRDNFKATLELSGQPPVEVGSAGPTPLDWPPIEVDSTVVDGAQFSAMAARARTTWVRLGELDPYFSLSGDPKFRDVDIGSREEAFYTSGQSEQRNLISFAARSGIELAGRTCLELGCGGGRVTRWLARLFRRVQAVDISSGQLAIAQRQMAEAGVENVSFTQIASLDELPQIIGYDVLFSVLVLQHNPPPLIGYILMQLLTNLNPGGVAYFQVPTYGFGYSFRIAEYLNKPIPEEPEIEMHVLPQRDVLKIVHGTGCRVLEVREDGYTGRRDAISNIFFVQKEA